MVENERKDERTGDSGGKSPKKLRVLLRTFGCQMNLRDSEVIAGMLKQEGYEIVADDKDADVIIYNTCAVREHAEEKVWSEIGHIFKRRKRVDHCESREPSFKSCENREPKTENRLLSSARTENRTPRTASPIIGLVGCMAKNYGQSAFERSPAVDFVVGPQDIAKIPIILKNLQNSILNTHDSILYNRKIWETEGEIRPEEIYHSGFRQDAKHAYIVISEGCSNFCSYCVVPFVRGPLRHRPLKEIIREIEQAASAGIREITLLGQNVNSYAGLEGEDFIRLLQAAHELKGVEKIAFLTSHPKDTHKRLFEAMASLPKVKKHLHLPVQSGSDRVLKLMNRGYNSKYYLDLAADYRKMVPEGTLSTDIIVGFPGESEEDFLATYRLLESVRFDSAFIFKYSPRPHSKAAYLPDDVLKQEKERRHKLILDLQRKISKRV